MNNSLSPLRIGVSTRALFALGEEHSVFEQSGVEAYAKLQRERETATLGRGSAFEVVKRLLALNVPKEMPLVDVVFLSHNSPDLSLRAFHSCEQWGLHIERGSFTSGRSVAPFVKAWAIDLFLSSNAADVQEASSAGTAAAILTRAPEGNASMAHDEVRIALDGDAVLFDAASDRIAEEVGLEAFLKHEREHAREPLDHGPFAGFLHKLSALRRRHLRPDGSSRVRIAIVTARNAPAHARVIHTLRAWGTPADEAHFVGASSKTPFLEAFGAHIFFDDREKHVISAAPTISSGLVPSLPHSKTPSISPMAKEQSTDK